MTTNREGLNRLMALAAHLDADDLADIIDLADLYHGRHQADATAADLWDRVLADPQASARLDGLLQEAREAATQGRVVDGPTAMAMLRKKYRLDEAQG
jgi:hypothetical protein